MKIMNKSQWKKIATMLLMVSMLSMNTMTQEQEKEPTSLMPLFVLGGGVLFIGVGAYFTKGRWWGKKELTKEEADKQIAEAQAILDKVKTEKKVDSELPDSDQNKEKKAAAKKAIEAAQKIFDDAKKEIEAKIKKDDKEKKKEDLQKAPNPAENNGAA